jgi:uncharacterized glyoxalase superfamily protein PhnB
MNIDAVGVTSSDMKKSAEFYSLLGFVFPKFAEDEQHLEATSPAGTRLMIDGKKLITEILGYEPKPANHSTFAIKFDSAEEVNAAAAKLGLAGYNVVKQPWDAFWGQRYCVVADPDGNMLDLFATL